MPVQYKNTVQGCTVQKDGTCDLNIRYGQNWTLTHISNEPGFAWDSPKEWYIYIYYKIQDISFASHSPKGMVIISEKYNLNINIIHMVDI